MKRALALLLALTTALPPGLIAGEAAITAVSPAPSIAKAFLDGTPLDRVPENGLNAGARAARLKALSAQKGPAAGEAAAAYAERVREAARGLGVKDADLEAAVARYVRGRSADPAGVVRGEDEARRQETEGATRAAGANARARALAGGFEGTAPDPGAAGQGPAGFPRAFTADQLRALNDKPAAQGGPGLHTSEAPAPATEPARSATWAESLQDAASEKLRAAQAVPQDGSAAGWARSRWLMAQGVGQFMAGKALDGATWSAAWRGAQDLGSYPDYAYGTGKAVVMGVVEDFTNVYHDGAKLIGDPNGAHAAAFTASAALLGVNFVGFGVPGALKTSGKVSAEVAFKAAAEAAAKGAAEEGVTAAARTAARAEFREANKEVIEANLRLAERAQRAAAAREQMPGLNDTQVEALLRAHEKFPCAGAGCTHADLAGKYKIMTEAGMTPVEIRETLDRGLAGGLKDWWNGVPSWKGAVKGFSLTSDGRTVVRAGEKSLEGVAITKDGLRLAAEVRKARSPAAILPMGSITAGGKPIFAGQMEASPTIISEYALKMANGTWDWSKGSKIVLRRGPKGEQVVFEGHHRVMAAALAGVPIPESAFAREAIAKVPYEWREMRWASR